MGGIGGVVVYLASSGGVGTWPVYPVMFAPHDHTNRIYFQEVPSDHWISRFLGFPPTAWSASLGRVATGRPG